jgi:hypothetical protein
MSLLATRHNPLPHQSPHLLKGRHVRQFVEELLDAVEHRHHRHRRVSMSVTLAPGQSVTETADATYEDASGATQFDPNSKVAWKDTSGGTAVTIVDNGTVNGVSTATVTYASAGTATLAASSTDSDGTVVSVGANNPTTITCSGAAVKTDATAVAITDGTPA